jgi:electron transfer flavoprotein beta subunit
VLCVGGPEVEPTLRKALAIGADDAVRINAPATDSAFVAREIAEYVKEKNFSIIFTGKESIDFNGGIVPGMIAEYLGLPFVPFASKMDLQGEDRAIIHREVDGGFEVIETTFPVVVSAQKGIAEWRIPNMRGIMAARKKPLSVVSPVPGDEWVSTVGFTYPAAKGECTYIEPDAAGKLIDALVGKGLI